MHSPERLIGDSPAMKVLMEDVTCAARSDAKVLITGESGVGKELVAGLIHQRSPRRQGPFVAVNCAGVPETLLESELFGHTRGSFTGAYRDRPGMFETAHRGSIFLDEVGEMSLRMQSLLLRFLETGEIQRVGAEVAPAPVDGRVIAATNRDLSAGISARTFREDLFYRLNVIHIRVPPLRERREDVPAILDSFLGTYAERYGVEAPRPSTEAMAHLTAYEWPGNVRELRNVAERLAVRAAGGVLGPEDLPAEITHRGEVRSDPEPPPARGVDELFERMATGRESFWSVVYDPFMLRDLTRRDVRDVVRRGLEKTRGSYPLVLQLFNMPPGDYRRFLNFLRKHQCHLSPGRSTAPAAGIPGRAPLPGRRRIGNA